MLKYFTDFYVNHRFGLSYIITEVLFVLSVVIILNRIEFTKKGLLRFASQALGTWLAVLVFSSFLYWVKNIGVKGEWHPVNSLLIVFPLVLALYAVFFSKFKWHTRLVVSLVFYSVFYSFTGLTEAIGYILRTDCGFTVDMTLISIVVLVAALTAYLYFFNIDNFTFVPPFCVTLICVAAVLTFAVMWFCSYSLIDRYTKLIVGFSFVGIEMLAYYMFHDVMRQYNADVTEQVLHDKRAGARDLLLASRKGNENVHVVLHDVKNQFACLKTLLENEKYDEAKKFLDEFEIFATPAIEAVDCGNVVIDSVVSIEKAKAQQQGVELVSSIAVPPALPLSDSDLCSVVCNLLDNAIESCVRENQKTVSAEIKMSQDYLFIRVANPVSDAIGKDERLKLHTSKSGAVHGYGTRIVKKIAEKHNGTVSYDVVDGKFVADVMLALVELEKK